MTTAEAVLFPIHRSERELDEEKYRNDPLMLETLRHAWATQDSLDGDIRGWRQPSSGSVAQVIAWLTENGHKNVTPYDYRRRARALAASLLFKITDGVPHQMATRSVNDDKWSPDQKRDYWRCVAICSAAWEPEA